MYLTSLALVICTKDRSRILSETLRSHLKQDVLPQYVVIVDSSQDLTAQQRLISDMASENPQIEFRLVASNPGLPLQRKVGYTFLLENFPSVRVASFLDDDVSLVEGNYFDTVMKLMNSNQGIVALSGFIKNLQLGVGARFLQWILGTPFLQGRVARSGLASLPQPKLDQVLTQVEWCQGGMISIRVTRGIERVFPEHLRMYGEDLEMSLRLKEFGGLAISSLLPVSHANVQLGKKTSDLVAYYSGAAQFGLSKRHPAVVDSKFVFLSMIRLAIANLVAALFLIDGTRLGLAKGYALVIADILRRDVREDTV